MISKLKSRLLLFVLQRSALQTASPLRMRKKALLAKIPENAVVLEIGPGLGDNLEFLPKSTKWIGIEPDATFHHPIQMNARKAGIEVKIFSNTAENIPLQENSVDYVIMTRVLCSVTKPEATIAQIQRVLKPGGAFLFIEHVAAKHAFHQSLQVAISPITKKCFGCNPIMQSGEIISNHFQNGEVVIEEFTLPSLVPGINTPYISGYAKK